MAQNEAALGDLPLSALVTFESVARHLRFARAADELRVTPTAVSKTIAQLEERLGVRLLNRTTRSVALTEAGARLLASASPALDALRRGLEDARATNDAPAGAVRVDMSYVAYVTLFAPHLSGFRAAFPKIVPEISIASVAHDVVARGFDAGVRPGRAVGRDMVALPLGPVQRLIVVGAPRYLAHAGRPKQPHDLRRHACIHQRLGADERFLSWALRNERNAKERWAGEVPATLVVDEMHASLDAARAGVGLAYVFERFAAPDLESGALVRVLEHHALVREAFYLYFPSRRSLPPKLRAFADYFRHANEMPKRSPPRR